MTYLVTQRNLRNTVTNKIIQNRNDGWGARIRTWECRYQKPVPYHLATPQQNEGKYKVSTRNAIGAEKKFSSIELFNNNCEAS